MGFAAVGLEKSFDDVDSLRTTSRVKNFADANAFIIDVLKIATAFVATLVLAVLIYGGFLYVTSAGSEQKAEQAKRVILYAIIGLILIGISAMIINVILFYVIP